jgi:hypothetical protein
LAVAGDSLDSVNKEPEEVSDNSSDGADTDADSSESEEGSSDDSESDSTDTGAETGSDSGTGSGSDSGSGSGSESGGGSGSGSDSGSGSVDGESGDGDGECDSSADDCAESSVGGVNCDEDLVCTGDAVQCAILSEEKKQKCAFEEYTDYEKYKPEIEDLFVGDDFTLDEGDGDIDIPSFVDEGTRFLPSSCPSDENFNLSMSGGKSFSLSYEPICQAAIDLSPLFVAVTTVLCALYVGRAVGGG